MNELNYVAVVVKPVSDEHCVVDDIVMSQQRSFRTSRRSLRQNYDTLRYASLACAQTNESCKIG